jgi:hypothetical protein
MRGPPDPEMRRAALAGSPKSQSSYLQPDQFSEAAPDYQAQTELARVFVRKFVVVRKRRVLKRSAER